MLLLHQYRLEALKTATKYSQAVKVVKQVAPLEQVRCVRLVQKIADADNDDNGDVDAVASSEWNGDYVGLNLLSQCE